MNYRLNFLIKAFIFFSFVQNTMAQGSILALDNQSYHTIDRLEISSNIHNDFLHSSLKPYLRGDVSNYALAVDSVSGKATISFKDRQDLFYIFRDNNEWIAQSENVTTLIGKKEKSFKKIYTDSTHTFYTIEAANQAEASAEDNRYFVTQKPLLKYFYKTPANMFEYTSKHFYFKANPMLNFVLGKENNDNQLIFKNLRGIEVRGGIDDRVYFYTNIQETQERFPNYVNQYISKGNAIPNAGFYKSYISTIFNIKNGYDYLNSVGVLGFNVTQHIGMQFGHGKNFIGNGIRSMLLSDFGNNYLYLKFNTKIGKFHYQNIFAELQSTSTNAVPGSIVLPKKYLAAHYLSYNFSNNFTLGFYEGIILNRSKQFELQYLNPIIFYRTIEGSIGSPDNAVLGLDTKLNMANRFQIYGQLLLDEFVFKEMFVTRRGYWANKFSVQAGIKYINMLGIDHLDGQLEFNLARPFTYTHFDSTSNYTHANLPLAHPLGANFTETIFKLLYQPTQKLLFDARLIKAKVGEDALGMYYGNNILETYKYRIQDYGNTIGQGIKADIFTASLDVSYQAWHNMFLDLHLYHRKKSSQDALRNDNLNYLSAGVRVNIGNFKMDY